MSTIEAPRRLEPARAPRPQAKPATRPDLRVVDRRRRRPSRRRIVSMLAISAFAVVLFLTVAGHVMILQQQQRIDRLNAQTRQEQADYNRLRLEVDRKQSPQRIVEEGRKLGLVQPPVQHWLTPLTSAPASGDQTGSADTSADGGEDYPQVKPFLGSTR